MKVYTCLVRNVHKTMFINVAAEAITAITITFLLSSDEFCFIWIFEQSAFVVLKVVFVPAFFIVSLFGVASVVFITDVLGGRVVDTNLRIGS